MPVNWLYRNVNDSSIDEATLEVVCGTTSSVLEQASKDDVHGLQAYTIQKMGQYIPTGKDVDHYKLLSAIGQPSEIPRCVMFPIPVSYTAIWRVSSD